MPNVIPLDQNGCSDGRSRHDLVLDKIVDGWFSEGFDDETVYFVEKDYFYTSSNVTQDEAYLVGDTRGDFDIAKYDLENNELEVREIKGNKTVPGTAEMGPEDRREQFEVIDDAHDQLSEVRDAVKVVETMYDVDIPVETEVVVWSDIFENNSFNSETLPIYDGNHYCTEDAYELARNSEEFEALNKGLFDGNILEKHGQLEKRK